MSKKLIIKKWGGENAAEFIKSPQNIVDDFVNGNKQAVVVSAIRAPEFNTTDNLINLSNLLLENENENEKELAYDIICKIKNFHKKVLKEKLGENEGLEDFIDNFFTEKLSKKINTWINYNKDDKVYPSINNDYSIGYSNEYISLIGFGEELSANLQVELINNLGISGLQAKKVNLDGVSGILKNDDTDKEIFKKLAKEIKTRVDVVLKEENFPVISGYIPGFKQGIENVIGRGYSDATAAMTAVGFAENKDVVLEIQKSVKGMLSTDPRIVNNPKLIESLDYLTAKEITGVRGSQAKLLHSQVLRKELLSKGIKIKLFDPFSGSKGTIISKNKNPESSGVEYIGARDNVIFFSISSWDMSDSGILSSVFDVVKKYNISVDIVSTSETEISFTIDNGVEKEILNSMVKDIQKQLDIEKNDDTNFVKYEKNKALVFCVGQNLANSIGALDKATHVLSENNINIKILSQGAMERSMVFGIDESNMKKAVEVLHKEFIN